MHPQLDKVRFVSCTELMDALEECHRQAFLKQIVGLCNFEKTELVKCLHHSRMEASREKIRQSRLKQKKLDRIRMEEEEETYGKNGYLRQVIAHDMKKLQEEGKR